MSMPEDHVLRVLLRDQTRLLAYLGSIVCDQHLADDLFQDLSIYALKNRESIQDEEHLVHWLRRVARSKAIDALRKEQRSPLVFDEELMDKMDRDWREIEQVSVDSMLQALRKCLTKLTPYGMRLLDLRYRDNLTGQALADVLDKSINTVNVALARLRRSLANCVRREMREMHD